MIKLAGRDTSSIRKGMGRVVGDIKAASGWRPGEMDFVKDQILYKDETREVCIDGVAVKRKIVAFRSNGCRWAAKKHGGCSMCAFYTITTGATGIISADDYLAQFRREVEPTDFREYPALCFFTGGSFLDDWEVPWAAQEEMFRFLGRQPHLKRILVESCAQYVREDRLARIRELLGDKELEVALGLETADPFVMSCIINKDYDLPAFERAASVLRKYARMVVYVLVKPPFLTEREALDMAVDTGRYAFDQGAAALSMEPTYVDRHSLVDYVFRHGYLYSEERFRPPWLWTTIEAIRRLHAEYPDREARLGYCDEVPVPYNTSRNCDHCSEAVYELIRQYAATNEVSRLASVDCSCRQEWQEDLRVSVEPEEVDERLHRFLEAYQALPAEERQDGRSLVTL